MRIKTNIFVWLFLATIVPLTVLALAATYYSESSYQQEVSADVQQQLQRLASEIKQQLRGYRLLAHGIARANAVHEILPALHDIAVKKQYGRFMRGREQINHYFAGLQTIIPESFFIRLLDAAGNTLGKVSHQQVGQAVYESISGINFVEQEINNSEFVARLRQLPREEVTAIRLPHHKLSEEVFESIRLHDYVVPLYHEEAFVGAISFSIFGEQLDQIIRNAARLYKGVLFVVRNEPDNSARHGELLYADEQKLRFSQRRVKASYVNEYYDEGFLDISDVSHIGEVVALERQYRYFFTELFPYANSLNSWIVVTRIETANITAPFQQIRLVIWLCAGIALVISLLLANIGTLKVVKPIEELKNKLFEYANGKVQGRINTKQGINEIDALAESFNYMADTLEHAKQERDQAEHMMLQNAKLASIGQMAAGIGHELNNPLNNILSYAKLIERSATNETMKKDTHSLRAEALRASDIVKGILNFARQVPPEYSSIPLPGLISDTLPLLNQAAREKGVGLQFESQYEGIIEGDRGQLQQVLVNLLLNAIQASRAGDTVLIKTLLVGHDLKIFIKDQGPGVSKAIRDKIFDPFFTTKAEGQGSGLGLSISLGIIERHGGTIQVDNQPKGGLCVTITLPLNAEPKVS